jgi:hypothetical protein
MIEAQIRSKMVIEQGKGKEKERDNCSTELEYYSLVHNIGCI